MKDDPDDLPPLADLLKPLSAKVMPRSAMYNIGGREMSDSRALVSQRHATQPKKRKGTRTPKKGAPA